jgi:protein involved in polysaccharide export with SLBB domain
MNLKNWHFTLKSALFILIFCFSVVPLFSQNFSPSQIDNFIQQARQMGVSEAEIERMKEAYYNQGNATGTSPAVTPIPSQVDTKPPTSTPVQELKEKDPITIRDTIVVRERYIPPKAEVPDIFGHAIFADSAYQALDGSSLSTPLDYIVGPGDEFRVVAYDGASFSAAFMVGSDGAVYSEAYPFLGKLYLAGLTYEQATKTLKSRLQRYLAGSPSIDVTLAPQGRLIKVNISGQVRQPGTYSLPASTSAFNALFAAGGINPLGSVRRIQVRRNGKLVQELDLYDFLSTGDSPPVYLQDRDFLFVPVQGKIVEVRGKVKQPMKYELKAKENLFALIDFSGGLRFDALRERAQVSRLQGSRPRVIDFELDKAIESQNDIVLLDGDVVDIKKQQKEITNLVKVDGAVYYPDTYEIQPGDRLMDLIARAGGLRRMAFMERAYIARLRGKDSVAYIAINLAEAMTNPNDEELNPVLRRLDRVIVFSEEDFREEKYLLVQGEIRKEGAFRVTSEMSLRDLLYLAGGPTVDADLRYVELSALVDAAQRDRLRKILARLRGGDSPYFIPQSSIDTINLPSPIKDSFEESDQEAVAAEAEENDEEEETLNTDEKVVVRIAIGKDWQQNRALDTVRLFDFDQIKLYSKYDFSFRQFIEIDGAVQKPGRYQVKPGMTVLDLLYRAGGLKKDSEASYIDLFKRLDVRAQSILNADTSTSGIVRINLDEDWRRSPEIDGIKASGFAKIFVYDKRDFFPKGSVSINGLVRKPGKYEFLPNMRLRDLLFQAGGPLLEADLSEIEVARVVEENEEGFAVGKTRMLTIKAGNITNWRNDPNLDILLNTYDKVFIRKNPEFQFQDVVVVRGEVKVYGAFAIENNSLTLAELVNNRAGGLTEHAYAPGAFILRPEIGKVSISLDKAVNRPASRYNIELLSGDTLVVPTELNIVKINGNVIQPGTIVQYNPGNKSFRHYVDLAGGFDRKTVRKRSVVAYQDGRVKRPHSFIFFRTYPKIEQGAEIRVAKRPEKVPGEKREREPLTFQEVLAGLTSAATLILLVRQSFR